MNANNYGDDGGGTGGAFSGEQFVLLVVAVANPYVVFWHPALGSPSGLE
jgi:hypothetical protein